MTIENGSIFESIKTVAERFPQSPALTDANRTYLYAALIDTVERLAQGLHTLAPTGPVAVLGDNHAANVLAWLAAGRSGVLVSLINSLLKAEELSAILTNLAPAILIVGDAHLEVAREALGLLQVKPILILRDGLPRDNLTSLDALVANSDPYQAPYPRRNQPFEVSYTSGTTSTPKGAVFTHDVVLFRAEQEIKLLDLTHEDAALMATPLFHQSGIRDTVLNCLLVGAHAVILPKFDAESYWELTRRYHATFACTVETLLLLLLRRPQSAADDSNPLRRAIGGGSAAVVEACESRFGLRLISCWGMTECGLPIAVPMDLSTQRLKALRHWRADAALAGWPLPGVEARIVDAAGGDCASGESGELLIRSRMVMQGYYRQSEASAKALLDGWMHTGDMATVGPDGAIYFLDRIRDVIRRGGENVAARQVEDVLNAHPGVERAAIVAVPDPVFMQEIKAVIQCRSGVSLSPTDLWQWCDAKLAKYKVPRYIEFRDRLPVNGSGRLQKQLLNSLPPAPAGVHDRREGKTSDA